jgi:hypothetical protein
MTAALKSSDGSVLEQWDGTALSHLPASAIANEFAYNRFAPGPFGLRAEMGAMATITLPAASGADTASMPDLYKTAMGLNPTGRMGTPQEVAAGEAGIGKSSPSGKCEKRRWPRPPEADVRGLRSAFSTGRASRHG